MFGTPARSGFRRGCGRASWRPPSDLVDQAHDSGALTDACTRKGPQMANPRPTPKPENLRPPWPPGTSGNPAGYSRGRRISDAIERLIEEMALDREFGATAIAMALHVIPVSGHLFARRTTTTARLTDDAEVSSGDTIPNCWGEFREIRNRKERRQPWGKLVGLGFKSNVRTIPIPPNWRIVHFYI